VHSHAGAAPLASAPDESAGTATGVSLSIAHRDGRAAAAACAAPDRIGVDLERAGSVGRSDLTRFMSARELARCGGLDATVLWTIKEAAWKALVLPRVAPFAALELVCVRGALTELRFEGSRWPARAQLHRPWPGYHATVVLARSCEDS
jgi:4'-phosphopantetheinyl transferase EntD